MNPFITVVPLPSGLTFVRSELNGTTEIALHINASGELPKYQRKISEIIHQMMCTSMTPDIEFTFRRA